MNAHDLFARHGEHAERVIVAQVLLHGEGEFGEIGQVLQIVRVDAGLVEGFRIERHVLISVANRPLHAFQLQRGDFVARGNLDWIQFVACGRNVFHGSISSRALFFFEQGAADGAGKAPEQGDRRAVLIGHGDIPRPGPS